MVKAAVPDLGSFIREQRERSALSLRKLADQAGISNPYLSQIERGLRRPSADILKSIARALSIRAESLYERAGLLEDLTVPGVDEAIEADDQLTRKQKQALTEIYESFVDHAFLAEYDPADLGANMSQTLRCRIDRVENGLIGQIGHADLRAGRNKVTTQYVS